MEFQEFKTKATDRIAQITSEYVVLGDLQSCISTFNLLHPPISGKIGGLTIAESMDKIESQLSINMGLNNVVDFSGLFNVNFLHMTELQVKEVVEGICEQVLSGSIL